MGFISGFPSLRFKFPNKLDSNSSNYDYLNGLNIDKIHYIVDKIDTWSKKNSMVLVITKIFYPLRVKR